ncbi:MAG: NAD(+) kinase [Gemmataceae bacterium]|mgnify:FL=1
MRVFVLGNAQRPQVTHEAEHLLPLIRQYFEVVVCDLEQKVALDARQADLAFVLGGDGAILRAAHQMGYQQVPILGINLGKLGFLADVHPEQVRDYLPLVAAGRYRITSHLMYECEVHKPSGVQRFLGLNEVVVYNGPPFQLIEIEVLIAGELACSFYGDGVIVSTPIGSTAHNLSAGGPILHQELSAFVITPICAHMLSNRSLVDEADKVYEIRVRHATAGTTLVVDGRHLVALTPDDRVVLRPAPVRFRLVKVAQSYYRTLRDKLSWSTPPRYRHEPPDHSERT